MCGFAAFITWPSSRGTIVSILFYPAFMFAFFPSMMLVGTTWRSQHQMSRVYLLSLPVSRIRMFNLLVLRTLAFWIPLGFLVLFLKTDSFLFLSTFRHREHVNSMFYPLAVIFGITGIQNCNLLTLFWQEEAMRYLSKQEQFIGLIKGMGFFLLSSFLLGLLGVFAVVSQSIVLGAVLLTLEGFVALGNYFLAREKWMGG